MILYFMEKFCFLFGFHNIFSYFCTIMVNQCRINWIDWAKVIAIFFVVFGHTPQERGDFLITYICTFHMPFFFMLSGFLSKGSTDTESNLRKHWHTLIIPYFFYNLIFPVPFPRSLIGGCRSSPLFTAIQKKHFW